VDNDEITKNIKALKLQGSPRGKGGRKQPPSRTTSSTASPSTEKKKSQKQMRVWDGQIAKGEMEALDYSGGGADDTVDEALIKAQHLDAAKLGTKNNQGIYEVQDVDVPDDDEDEDYDFGDDDEDDNDNASNKGGIFSFFKSMTGQREMTAETLDPVLATMKDSMIDKNVGKEIADRLCESVKSSLLGKKLGSFERK
jgi:signal recognition particle receptor subunit alpha